MFTIRADYSETLAIATDSAAVRRFFTNVSNLVDFIPYLDSIRNDNRGIAHWQISAKIPMIGSFSERFPVIRTEDSDERVEWSPETDERFNLLKFAADFLQKSATETMVKVTQNIELRRNSASEFHMLAGFAGETLISNEMTARVAQMMQTFIEQAKTRLER